MNLVYIEATTLPDAWFLALEAAVDKGRKWKIDSGSYAGQYRYELDYVTLRIKFPQTKPIIPEMPPGMAIPPPTTMEYVEDYLNYLMTDAPLQPNESYTYGARIHHQMEEVIRKYNEHGFGTNQCTISVAQPDDIYLEDPPCFPEGTMVITLDGLRDISKVKVGQKVLTHTGRWREVLATHKRHFSGELRRIVTRGNARGLLCTPNHEVFGVRTTNCAHSDVAMCKPSCRKRDGYIVENTDCAGYHDDYVREWIPAEKLFKYTYIATPRRVDTSKTNYDNSELFLMGVFLADGFSAVNDKLCFTSIQRKNKNRNEVDRRVIDSLLCYDKVALHMYVGSSLMFYSQKLADKYRGLFPFSPEFREIPGFFFELDEESLYAIFQGWFTSAGKAEPEKNRVVLNVVSKSFMRFAEFMLTRLGYIPNVAELKAPDSTTYFRLTWVLNKKSSTYWTDEDNVYISVKENVGIPFEGDVYNLGVAEDNSYTANGISVHNCLRSIDCRVVPEEYLRPGEKQALHFFLYFRSWDLFNGFPPNLAAISMLQEYMASSIEVPPGEFICSSKGLHIYDYAFGFAEQRVGEVCEELLEKGKIK
ncbi:MAG: thymidylate synthase [Candidatus Hodarchaeales archaeon]|jgi:hypothetical protein